MNFLMQKIHLDTKYTKRILFAIIFGKRSKFPMNEKMYGNLPTRDDDVTAVIVSYLSIRFFDISTMKASVSSQSLIIASDVFHCALPSLFNHW